MATATEGFRVKARALAVRTESAREAAGVLAETSAADAAAVAEAFRVMAETLAAEREATAAAFRVTAVNLAARTASATEAMWVRAETLALETASATEASRITEQTLAVQTNRTRQAAQVRTEASAVDVTTIPASSLAETRSVGLNILVVDDNPINQRLAVRMLEREGHRVDVASNGEEALDAVSSVRYAAVLMDCRMPIMDGYQTTRAIRHLAAPERDVPIIAMTAGASLSDHDRCLAAGMDDYISKPIWRKDLVAVVMRCTSSEEGLSGRDPDHFGQRVSDLSTANSAGSLDPSMISALKDLDGQGGDVSQLVQSFLVDVFTGVEKLRGCVGGEDATLVAGICHQLRGSSAAFGASMMAGMFAEFEGAVSTGVPERAPDILRRLEAELSRVQPALTAAFPIGLD